MAAQEFEMINIRCLEYDRNTPVAILAAELFDQARSKFLAYRHGAVYQPETVVSPLPVSTEKIDNLEGLQLDKGIFLITGGTGNLGREVSRFLRGLAV